MSKAETYKRWVENNYGRRLEINNEWAARNREQNRVRAKKRYQEKREELREKANNRYHQIHPTARRYKTKNDA